jgi:hypothetical protein
MSEHTPITGNLRQAMVQWGWADGREVTITDLQPSIDAEPFLTIRGGRFGELCDAIDAVHANLERENARLKAELDEAEHRGWTRGYDEGFSAADDWMADNRDAMAEHGWVELPKDADGVTIHAGDVLDGYGKTIEVVELRYGRSGWVLISRDGNAYADTYAFSHRQPDSWERIIDDAEALAREWFNTDMSENEHAEGLDALVARCKKLASDAE